MKYNKLVRDKIPEIIANNGQKATFRVLDKTEYLTYLEKKLDEEVAEFHESKSIEELADILQVIISLTYALGSNSHKLRRACVIKMKSVAALIKEYV